MTRNLRNDSYTLEFLFLAQARLYLWHCTGSLANTCTNIWEMMVNPDVDG